MDARPGSLRRLASLLSAERGRRLNEAAERARDVFGDHTMWHVNATGEGGGVAEMLAGLVGYSRAAGIDTRWLVLDTDADFFAITKRVHNRIHGSDGDGGPLGEDERETYEAALRPELKALTGRVRPCDVVVLHDPQTAGLVPGLLGRGVHVVWRSHIGSDTSNEQTEQGWAFLRPYVTDAERLIFSRLRFVPDWVPEQKRVIIPPSIDPFAPKNIDLDAGQVSAVVARAGLVANGDAGGDISFVRADGSTGEVQRYTDLLEGDEPPPADARLVLQVSRWDRLKDMEGVLRGFADHLDELPDYVHLMLAGPSTSGVSDDPEGTEVFADCREAWQQLPDDARRRTHLASLPMDDVDENARLVNALQRHAHVIVQKSLVEGFGLTVTEAMWKGRPVIASAIGGIHDQITDGENGLLLSDPSDLDAFAETLVRLLGDDELAERLGQAARASVEEKFLGDRQLIQYAELLVDLTQSE